MDKKEKENRAKAWCFDNGRTVEEMERAWEKGVEAGNPILKNLDRHRHTWLDLAPHLLPDLLKRYGENQNG